MVEPEKPFACTMPECGMTFTNEDHLHVHTKKHDMVLQLGLEQKSAFVADQTPTPTRFIRNCEEVGLFQDLQSVNPFDEGFKRAMETREKHSILSLENAIATSSSDELHTPQMIFPLIDPGDSTLFSTTNNQRNITISRSSSDESGAIKEFETTTISKLTNEVTTISRVVEKHDDHLKSDDINRKDGVKKDSVSYTNNVIKIHSEIRKDCEVNKNPIQTLIYEDTVIKNNNVIKDVLLTDSNKLEVPDIPPIMSQKSIDLVVDSFTSDLCNDNKKNVSDDKSDNYEVIIKLPNGKQVRMKSVEEFNERNEKNGKTNAKEKLRKALTEKVNPKVIQRINSVPVISTVPNSNAQIVSNIVPITTGTLIPVTLLNPSSQVVHKIPIIPLNVEKKNDKIPVKRKSFNKDVTNHVINLCKKNENNDCVIIDSVSSASGCVKNNRKLSDSESKSAASRRYRARLKDAWIRQSQENSQLKEINERLIAEKAMLKLLITEHMKKCPNADDLRIMQDKLKQPESFVM